MDVLLVVDAMGLHHLANIALENPGHFNRKLLDAQCSVLFVRLLALAALLLGFRRQLLLGHGLPLRFHVLANQAMPAATAVASLGKCALRWATGVSFFYLVISVD